MATFASRASEGKIMLKSFRSTWVYGFYRSSFFIVTFVCRASRGENDVEELSRDVCEFNAFFAAENYVDVWLPLGTEKGSFSDLYKKRKRQPLQSSFKNCHFYIKTFWGYRHLSQHLKLPTKLFNILLVSGGFASNVSIFNFKSYPVIRRQLKIHDGSFWWHMNRSQH